MWISSEMLAFFVFAFVAAFSNLVDIRYLPFFSQKDLKYVCISGRRSLEMLFILVRQIFQNMLMAPQIFWWNFMPHGKLRKETYITRFVVYGD